MSRIPAFALLLSRGLVALPAARRDGKRRSRPGAAWNRFTARRGGLCRDAARLCQALLLAAMAAGCSDPRPWQLHDISGLMPNLALELRGDGGRRVDAARFRGKLTLLYFGYTHCPDVCPTTLANLAGALRQLGPEADDIRVLFVSVDPQRDNPEFLRRYVQAFGPWFVGLTGSDKELRALSKRYRVTYNLGKPDAQGDYAVTHSNAVFVFDRQGRVRLLATEVFRRPALVSDLRRLAAES